MSVKNAGPIAHYRHLSFGQRVVRDWKLNKWKYLLIIPVVVYLYMFCYRPMGGLVIAFKNYKPTRGIGRSAWMDPWYAWFEKFFTAPYFGRLIGNTFTISILTIVFGFPAPILLALLLNEINHNKFKRTVQTITYMPYFISMVVTCALIRVYCQQDGLLSDIVVFFGGQRQNWLMNSGNYRTIYIISEIWQTIGWNSIIYLAALSGIDQEQYEAARIDGANRFQQCRHITLPGLMPTIIILFILRMGRILSVGYEKTLLLYNSNIYDVSDIISTYTYRLSFGGGTPQYSYSTAIGLFNTLVNVVFLLATNFISSKVSDSSLF